MSTREITGGALMAAASVVLMALSAVFPTLSVTCAAFSGFIIMCAYIKWGMKTAVLSYVTASLLGIMLLPNREAAILFATLFGQYPMIKAAIERKSGILRSYSLKLAYFNLDMLAIFWLTVVVLGFEIVDPRMPLWFAALFMNAVFLLYDRTFTPLMAVLTRRFSKFFGR